VVCADNYESKVDVLRRGEVAIAEPGLAEIVGEGLAREQLAFTTDLAELGGAEVVLL
jgi:UDPglucose 6-dehydrogenase